MPDDKRKSDAFAAITADSPSRFLNRDLSWLQFNRRVLEEAMNHKHPLLERARFLSINASNLDEFTTARVASIETMPGDPTGTNRTDDGLKYAELIERINDQVRTMLHDQQICWLQLKDELAAAGIVIVEPHLLPDRDRKWLSSFFEDNIYPMLTPVAISAANPFPFIPNLGVALVLKLRHKDSGDTLNAILPIPVQLERFIRLPASSENDHIHMAKVEFTILDNIDKFFHDFALDAYGSFRVLRNTEVKFREVAGDLVGHFESALKERYRGHIVRVGVTTATPPELIEVIRQQLDVPAERIIANRGMIRVSDLKQLVNCGRPDLLFPPYQPRFPERIHEYQDDYFAAIRAKEIIVHHPYETFDVVVEFVRQAAADPNVVAIKQTLYRTSKDSPIINSLIQAAEAGKAVTVMVELKARFDEEANIRWAKDLERVGAQVVFGFMELKTHAKVLMVVRKEGDLLRTYVHYGTGNYHPVNAKTYTDLSLFTCDPDLAHDAAQLFNFMTGYSTPADLRKIRVAPLNIRPGLMELIDAEIAHAKAGRPAAIWAKMNALVDRSLTDKLYEASQAGVQIELIIRGSCNLRPGVPGLSENIHVRSLIGRFLEHSRIACFGSGHGLPSPEAKVFITSADWMPRNLDRRIEVMVPITQETVRKQVLEQIMVACLKDTDQTWELDASGHYARRGMTGDDFSAQEYFMRAPSHSGRGKSVEQPSPLYLDGHDEP